MAHILDAAISSPPTQSEVAKVVANKRRRERYIAARRDIMPDDLAAPHSEVAMHAYLTLAKIQRTVKSCEFDVLTAVAIGTEYEEIARATGARPGALRVKVLRLRREFLALVE